ncbi:MAG: hypothetical protein GY719_24405 [bacterium]|nr:hypothetical protein [bacterium]
MTLLVCILGLAVAGCGKGTGEPESAMLEDLDQPAAAGDEALKATEPQPLPEEVLEADPGDPRASAMLADLDDREEAPARKTAAADEPIPLPEEEPE